MNEIDEDLITQVSFAWKNSCLERVPAIGDQMAERLAEELRNFPTVYKSDEEIFMVGIKNICSTYTLTPNQMRSLVRSLSADFYRLITQKQHGLPTMSSSQSAFGNFDDLITALQQGAKVLEEIEAGNAPPIDIDALFSITPEHQVSVEPKKSVTEALEFDLSEIKPGNHTARMMEMINRYYARWEDTKIVIRSQEVARNLRQQALVRLLELARTAECFPPAPPQRRAHSS